MFIEYKKEKKNIKEIEDKIYTKISNILPQDIIAILKEAVTGLAALWTSGVLPIILGVVALGGGIYYGSKHGWFKKLKDLFIEEVPVTKTNTKTNTTIKLTTIFHI